MFSGKQMVGRDFDRKEPTATVLSCRMIFQESEDKKFKNLNINFQIFVTKPKNCVF
jgi:hypothetical protein